MLNTTREATSCTDTQELRKTLPLVPTLTQINPVHAAPFLLSKISFNIITLLISKSS
jgi:hypothetical protein